MTDNQGIQERTLTFAVRIVKLCRFLHEKGGNASSVLGVRCSVLGVRCSVLGVRCSVLGVI